MPPYPPLAVNQLVYVVDDSAEYRQLIQSVFTRFLPHYNLCVFEDGQLLLQALDTPAKPDLLVVDGQMPVLNGCEIVKLIRQHAEWKYIPVVIMSNTDQADEVSACYMAGANSFLVKPTDSNSMRQVMQSLCFYWFEMNQRVINSVTGEELAE